MQHSTIKPFQRPYPATTKSIGLNLAAVNWKFIEAGLKGYYTSSNTEE